MSSGTRVVTDSYLGGLIGFEGGYVTRNDRITLCFFLIAVFMLLCCVHFYLDLETLALTPRSVPLTLKLAVSYCVPLSCIGLLNLYLPLPNIFDTCLWMCILRL